METIQEEKGKKLKEEEEEKEEKIKVSGKVKFKGTEFLTGISGNVIPVFSSEELWGTALGYTGIENERGSGSGTESQSVSQSVSQSGSGSGSGSQSGIERQSGSGSQSGYVSKSGSGSGSGNRLGCVRAEIETDSGSDSESKNRFGPIIECVPEDSKGGLLESASVSAGNVLVS